MIASLAQAIFIIGMAVGVIKISSELEKRGIIPQDQPKTTEQLLVDIRRELEKKK